MMVLAGEDIQTIILGGGAFIATTLFAAFAGLLRYISYKYMENIDELNHKITKLEQDLLFIKNGYVKYGDMVSAIKETKEAIERYDTRIHDRIDHIYRLMKMNIREDE